MMDRLEFFRCHWADLAKRLSASLARRGVPRDDRDDIVQETAIRLYRAWDQLEPGRPVEPYAYTIAANLWRDSLRRRPMEDLVEDVPDVASVAADPIESVCVARDELSRVGRALALLRPEQRRVLHDAMEEELTGAQAGPTPDAVRMSRMRARRQLRAALQIASGVAAAFGARLRRARVAPAATALSVSVALMVGGSSLPPAEGRVAPADVQHEAVSVKRARPASVPAVRERPTARRAAAQQPKAPAREVRAPRRATDPDYYWIKTGPANAGVLVEVTVDEHRIVVGESGNTIPVCSTVTPPTVPSDAVECRRSAGSPQSRP